MSFETQITPNAPAFGENRDARLSAVAELPALETRTAGKSEQRRGR